MAAGLVLGALTGCTPPPAPEPTPTFAGEEEAFAAAEATYRAYVDALNAVDLSDPETFEDVYAWTTGELNASDRRGLSEYHASATTVTGESHVDLLEAESVNSNDSEVLLFACLNVSGVQVLDRNGNSLVDPDRTDVQRLRVNLSKDEGSPTGWLIESIGPREEGPDCA